MKPDLITTDCCSLTERELGQSVCCDEGRLSDAKFGANTPVTPPASPRPPLPTRLADEDLQESWWSLELQTVTQTWPGGGLQRLLVQWTFVTSRCLENSNYKYRNSIEIYFRWCSWNACSSQLQWYNHKQYYQVCQLKLNNALECQKFRDYVGWAWYDTQFYVFQGWQNSRVMLRSVFIRDCIHNNTVLVKL